MFKCDSEGVPKFVQKLVYMGGSQCFKVTQFDGKEYYTTTDYVPGLHYLLSKINYENEKEIMDLIYSEFEKNYGPLA